MTSSGVGGGVGGDVAIIIIILIVVWACRGNPSTALAVMNKVVQGVANAEAAGGQNNINPGAGQQYANDQQLPNMQFQNTAQFQANMDNQMWATAQSTASDPIVWGKFICYLSWSRAYKQKLRQIWVQDYLFTRLYLDGELNSEGKMSYQHKRWFQSTYELRRIHSQQCRRPVRG